MGLRASVPAERGSESERKELKEENLREPGQPVTEPPREAPPVGLSGNKPEPTPPTSRATYDTTGE